MIIKYQALSASLQKKTYALYVLIGNDHYLLNDAALQIKQSFLKHECSQTTIDLHTATDWSLLMAKANSYSLFTEYDFLDARFDKKSIDVAGKELLSTYLEKANENCLIMLRAPQLPVKSLQWLTNNADALIVQMIPFTALALKQWINAQLQSKGLKVETNVAELIYQSTQGNMLATAQVIDKLALSLVPNKVITAHMLREQLNDQSHFEIYALTDAYLTANTTHVIRLLQQFRLERVEPTFILWILTQEIRLLIQLHYLKQSLSMEAACTQLKIWSSRVKLYSDAIARLSLETLLSLLQTCKQMDEMMKTSQSMQLWDRFEVIALSLCGVWGAKSAIISL